MFGTISIHMIKKLQVFKLVCDVIMQLFRNPWQRMTGTSWRKCSGPSLVLRFCITRLIVFDDTQALYSIGRQPCLWVKGTTWGISCRRSRRRASLFLAPRGTFNMLAVILLEKVSQLLLKFFVNIFWFPALARQHLSGDIQHFGPSCGAILQHSFDPGPRLFIYRIIGIYLLAWHHQIRVHFSPLSSWKQQMFGRLLVSSSGWLRSFDSSVHYRNPIRLPFFLNQKLSFFSTIIVQAPGRLMMNDVL